ncbi:transcriptional regulator, LysR family [Desulfovibrio sp. X2]|uniref:LysR family transcriptional regulator n=1 Tax=Desulfovibrio sp. X2 TaxID=941449 RepID=UPI000358E16E|nr:LysR family transcriptional regulator [Desulfovibrio sp. X2]EPR36359.1 transcriptional regulator, LysR family [Desulfovibrio sp. X2]
MELRTLEQFVAVAEELHFGHAAERLHMSQPPLSQAVRRLEDELGVELLARTRRRVRLTAAGEAFLRGAREVLAAAGRAAEAARRAARGEVGSLSLGFVGPATGTRLPGVIRDFAAAWPEVRLSLAELPTLEQLSLLAAGRLDVGVVRLLHEPGPPLASRLFHSEPYVAVLPAGHALAGGGPGASAPLELAALRDEPLILYPRGQGPDLYDAVVGACAAAGFAPRIVQEVVRKETTLALVGAGLGLAFLPRSAVPPGDGSVACRELAGGLPPVELYLAWTADNDNPALKSFLALA